MSRFLKRLAALRGGRRLLGGLGLLLCLGMLRSLSGCHSSAGDQSDGGVVDARSEVQQGKLLVAMYGCASCHEPSGKQDGILSGQTSPRPGTTVYGVNLTPDSATGIGDWTDDQLAKAIREGIDDEDAALCPTMPHFSMLSDSNVKAIIAYLRSLPATHSEIPESECPPIKPIPGDGGTTDGP